MAENKEITTLHPYMNRNKNRYPNVKDENIPDTIQRKLTAGTGISISPENVISATGGDSYTRSETDALLETKADKVALENVNKVVPTDIAVKDGKLGLEHDTTWLTNQNAITLGDGLTYDEATKTLKAEGAELPTGKTNDPFKIGSVKVYNEATEQINFKYLDGLYGYITFGRKGLQIISRSNESGGRITLSTKGGYNKYGAEITIGDINFTTTPNAKFYINNDNKANDIMYIPALERPSTDGKYNLQITKTGSSYHYDWVAGGGKTYNHYIVISDGTASNAIYLLIPSTNNIICSSLPDLNTLLGTEHRFIQASGVVTDTASKLPIVAINWQGSFSSSKIVTMSSEEATTKFTDISDIVEPA